MCVGIIKYWHILADQEVSALLVTADFAESDGAGAVAMGALDAGNGRAATGASGGLAGSRRSYGLGGRGGGAPAAGGLLDACHLRFWLLIVLFWGYLWEKQSCRSFFIIFFLIL